MLIQCCNIALDHFCQKFANYSTIYFILSKVYTDEGGIKYLYHGLSAGTIDNPLAKTHGLSHTGGR